MESWTYQLDNIIGYFTNPCSMASWIIMISTKKRIPATKSRTSYHGKTNENPKKPRVNL